MEAVCGLCARTPVETTEHHLIPKEEGGHKEPTVDLCIPCHKNVHALFTNKELAVLYNTVDALRSEPRMAKFISWIRKQPTTTMVKTKRSREKTMKM